MSGSRLLARGLLLIAGLGIAAAASAETAWAAAPPSSSPAMSATVVIRGSDPATTQPPSDQDTPPLVLRGSPPAAAQPPSGQFACPPGYGYAAGYDCLAPSYVYAPEDYGYGYWPYWGFDAFFSNDRRHRLSRRFARDIKRGFPPRVDHHLTNSFGRGFVHGGGFGRR
jgi:hypothetical protein